MPRVRFELLDPSSGVQEVVLPRPHGAPDGYTPIILLTEWLTLNCRGAWASRAGPKGVRVRFSDGQDCTRALARFAADFSVAAGAP